MPPTEFIIFTAEPGLVPFRRRSDHFRTNHEYRPLGLQMSVYDSQLLSKMAAKKEGEENKNKKRNTRWRKFAQIEKQNVGFGSRLYIDRHTDRHTHTDNLCIFRTQTIPMKTTECKKEKQTNL